MKHLFACFLLLLFSIDSYCQTIKGQVISAQDKAPLSFASVSIENTNRGTITNENGYFELKVGPADSLVLISYVGFLTKKVGIKELSAHSVIQLDVSSVSLLEIVISDSKSQQLYLADLLTSVRKKIIASKKVTSKAYMKIQSDEKNFPIELMECYYNVTSTSNGIVSMALKNGRAGIYKNENHIFITLNSSMLFEQFTVATSQQYMPFNPLQLRKGEILRYYDLYQSRISEDSLTLVSFKPKDASGKFFRGECWIDLKNRSLKKLELFITNATNTPLLPIRRFDRLDSVDLSISYSFIQANEDTRLASMSFHFDFDYYSLTRSTANALPIKIRGKGLLYLFDFEKEFILPYYQYDPSLSDYHKIALTSVNADFWKLNNPIPKTLLEQNKLVFFDQKGLLLNYFSSDKQLQRFIDSTSHTLSSVVWKKSNRLVVLNDIKIDTIPDKHAKDLILLREYFRLVAQIYLDINVEEDTIQYYSASIMDGINTFINLPKEDYSNVFVNIFFDLVEIKRREMEEHIKSKELSREHILQCYNQTKKELEVLSTTYQKEVNMGKEYHRLKYYNDLVNRELGINNFQLFKIDQY